MACTQTRKSITERASLHFLSMVPSRKHKSWNIAIWWLKKHLAWANCSWQTPFRNRFLTFRLLQKWSVGFPCLVISFQNKTQLLQTALFRRRSSCLSLRTFRVDRTNTTLLNLCCFRSFSGGFWPRVALVTYGQCTCQDRSCWWFSHQGPIKFRPQAHGGKRPLTHGKLTYRGRFSWGLNMVPAISAAHAPRGTLERFPEGLCPIRSRPAGRRAHQ